MSHGKKFDEYLILNIEPRIWRVSEREREMRLESGHGINV